MQIFGNMTSKTGESLPTGMNNRVKDHAVPDGQYRNAVNIDFDDEGNIQFPRIGSSKVYAGTDCHSWYQFEDSFGAGIFIEGAELKRLNSNNTVTALKTVGNQPMSYCQVNGVVYFSNSAVTGRYRDGQVIEWGIPTPFNQLNVSARNKGGLHAGIYLVTLTWLSNGEESGADISRSVTVEEGGGIRLTNFPSSPAFVEQVAVYVSSPNGSELYLYDEYPSDIQVVDVQYFIGDAMLETQFAIKPQVRTGLTVHSGRIYWIDGQLVRCTMPHNFLLQEALAYFVFEEPVTNIISTQGPLFVTTELGIYQVSGIDGEGLPELQKVKNYGAAAMRLPHNDQQNDVTFVMADVGMIAITAGGVKELHLDKVAPPKFKKGCISVIDQGGVRKLISVCQDGVISRLQSDDYTTTEALRNGTGL